MLTAYGYENKKSSLQSKRGRHMIMNTLASTEIGLVVQLLMDTIESL